MRYRPYKVAIVAILIALVGNISVADDLRYRVSGVIVTAEKQIAVVEKSDGTQQLYRPGDIIDSFVVERVDSDGVYLGKHDREIFLELEGTPSRLEDVAATLRAQDLKVSDGNAMQAVNYDDIGPVLSELALDPSVTDGTSKDIAERLNVVLGLPTYTVISAVDRKQIRRPEMAVLLLAQKFERGSSVRLEVGGSIPGVDVLYLSPAE